MDPLIREIFPEFCLMKVLKGKGKGKFQSDDGYQAGVSYEFYTMFKGGNELCCLCSE